MNTQTLLEEAKKRGMKVELFQGKLSVVRPKGRSPEFVKVLRAHKTELLHWFAVEHLIKQIHFGEFTECDPQTTEKLVVMLKRSKHPLARNAIEFLLHDA